MPKPFFLDECSAHPLTYPLYVCFKTSSTAIHLSSTDRCPTGLVGSMIAALEKLKAMHEPSHLPEQMAAFGINGGDIQKIFSSHPPLDERIAALRNAA